MLLLGVDPQYIRNWYFKLFFELLSSTQDRAHFLTHFTDEKIIKAINDLVALFIKFPFQHKEIQRHINSNFISFGNEEIMKCVTKYQRDFYITTYLSREEDAASPFNYYNRLKESNNRSFESLRDLDNDASFEGNFIEAYGKLINKKNHQISKMDMIKRGILLSTFDKYEKGNE